jgi:Na+-transporting NADH:ubiquinone oxidoreductase subunit NqrC
MKRSFPQILHFLIIFTSIGIGVVTWCIIVSLANYTGLDIGYFIITIIFSTILSVFVGAYAYVMFSIPFELNINFDKIKNKLASGELSDIDEVQKVIGRFLINSFNYLGLDITDAIIYFKGSKNPEIFNESHLDIDSIDIKELSHINKIRINRKHKAFYIPVIFEEEELGYLVLITKGYTSPFFLPILEYFEDYFLDDFLKIFTRIKN